MTFITKSLPLAALAVFATMPATAQEVAPGWRATGHWQCGGVRVLTSTDGQGGLDFHTTGTWSDSHYTLQRGTLFYNGYPCQPVGMPWPLMPKPRPKQLAQPDEADLCDTSKPVGQREC